MNVLAPKTRIDWFRILEDVGREGFTLYDVAHYTTIPKSTLLGYRNLGAEPRHAVGDALLAFWSQVMGRPVSDAPRVARMASVAATKR